MVARPVIRVAAALIVDGTGQLLLVRKRGTGMFMQAGGKIEPQETPLAALVRELGEELGLTLDGNTFEYLGRFDTQAANEHGHDLIAEVFAVETDQVPVAAAEIDELRWVDPASHEGIPLAPLTTDVLIPLALDRWTRAANPRIH
ncbi:NUDIX domain-containing protein [Glaciihabitans sp. dw_435]|uniref:NUDIX hydrolase n=1 Tax=Glaciihabitans sp. dw_435 TaxID=2720081 RepID=UPI001BD3DD4D|nr:NUDIX domain-containing protein [Glaciihabitans sp. dw_435]